MSDLKRANVRSETWREINRRKEPGDTVDDVIRRLIGDENYDDERPEYVTINLDASTYAEVMARKRDGDDVDDVFQRVLDGEGRAVEP